MLFQPCEAIGEEPFAPQRYHFTSGVEIGGDLVVYARFALLRISDVVPRVVGFESLSDD